MGVGQGGRGGVEGQGRQAGMGDKGAGRYGIGGKVSRHKGRSRHIWGNVGRGVVVVVGTRKVTGTGVLPRRSQTSVPA